MKFYIIKNIKSVWGDYGNTLLYGFISKESNDIIIERVGPFIPSVYIKNKYVAINSLIKRRIEETDMNSLTISSTIYKKIVNIDWQKWDITNIDALVRPKSGEPEDYILKNKNDLELIKTLDETFVIIPNDTGKGIIDRNNVNNDTYSHLSLDLENWNGDDVFRTPELGHIFCTEKFKKFIEQFPDSYIRFIPISIKDRSENE